MPTRRRCWRRGGRVARRDGGWASSPQRSCFGRGEFLPRREGPRPHALATSPHPPRRSLGSPAQLTCPSGVHTHAPDPDQPRTTPSLTTLLAPCLADRVFFASTSDFLASAPIDGLQGGEAGKLHLARARVLLARQRREKKRQAQRGDARAMDLRACECDVRCVAWEERRCPLTI